jgi:aldehyde dehydrogenase (NAD+)
MRDYLKFYIDGAWVDPAAAKTLDVINPATEAVAGRISLGSAADVDRAARAARRAFDGFSRSSREDRLALLGRIVEVYRGNGRAGEPGAERAGGHRAGAFPDRPGHSGRL